MTTMTQRKVRIYWNEVGESALCWRIHIKARNGYHGPLGKMTELFCNTQPDMPDDKLIEAAMSLGMVFGSGFKEQEVLVERGGG